MQGELGALTEIFDFAIIIFIKWPDTIPTVTLNLMVELISPNEDMKKCEKLKRDYNRKNNKLPRTAIIEIFAISPLGNSTSFLFFF